MATVVRSLRLSSFAGALVLVLALAQALAVGLILDVESIYLWVTLGIAASLAGDLAWYLAQRRLAELDDTRHEIDGLRNVKRWRRRLRPQARAPEIARLRAAVEALRRRMLAAVRASRRMRQETAQASSHKMTFLNSVSHELRNPLNAILGFSQVLLEEIEGPLTPSQREDVRCVHASGEHLLSLFNDIIDFSTVASGELGLQREAVEVEPLIRETVQLLEAQRRDRPVRITAYVESGLPCLDGERKRLKQILMNLASNALKFTECGQISLQALSKGERVVLIVQDTGVGIAEEEKSCIFGEFEQATAGRMRKLGSGLGLAIAKQLIELHGGEVSVDSQVGRGSTFTVDLPAWEAR